MGEVGQSGSIRVNRGQFGAIRWEATVVIQVQLDLFDSRSMWSIFPHGSLAKQGDVGKVPQLFRIRIRTPLKIRAVIGWFV